MNYYATIALFLLAIFFIYASVEWLGTIFLLIGIISLFAGHGKKVAKSAWKEIDKASGSAPVDKFKSYAELTGKKSAELLTPKKDQKMNVDNFIHKIPDASKSFFSEIKSLFK